MITTTNNEYRTLLCNKMHIKDYQLPNPANTEHHHAVRTNIKDYQLLIKDNKATLPVTVLPSRIANSHNLRN